MAASCRFGGKERCLPRPVFVSRVQLSALDTLYTSKNTWYVFDFVSAMVVI